MPRVPRKYLETTFFHVMTQGINKSYIFENKKDAEHYVKLICKLAIEEEVKVEAYCIMNNHAHLLLEVNNAQKLSKYMRRLGTKYALYYNKKYNRVGYVFRDRYRLEPIFNEEHLYNCIQYIYDNPVKAGICKKAEDYPYSNCRRINKKLEGGYIFIDTEEESMSLYLKADAIEVLIEKFLFENQMTIEEVKNDKEKLYKLVVMLKNEYKVSLRKIAEMIDMKRETVRKIYNKKVVN